MKKSTRKILRKIGAGLMLGLSLFNLGASWNKAGGLNTIKRSKRVRLKEQDQVDSEMEVFAQVAGEEAEKVIEEKNVSQQEAVLEKQETNLAQSIYRFSATVVLGVAFSVFMTSMLLNYPFALGKGMLALFPGNPHLAVLSLSANKENMTVGEDFIINVELDSAGEVVDNLKLVLEYDPNLVFFDEKDISEGWIVDENKISENLSEIIILSNKNDLFSRKFFDENIMTLDFKVKKIDFDENVSFSINKNKSIVFSKKGNKVINVLGKTKGLKIFITK